MFLANTNLCRSHVAFTDVNGAVMKKNFFNTQPISM